MNIVNRFLLLIIFLVVLPRIGYSQNGTIRGTIIEESSGEPVYGVTVLVVGTSNGTTTDFDGKFDLSLSEGEYDLRITYVSYRPIVIEDIEVESDESKV